MSKEKLPLLLNRECLSPESDFLSSPRNSSSSTVSVFLTSVLYPEIQKNILLKDFESLKNNMSVYDDLGISYNREGFYNESKGGVLRAEDLIKLKQAKEIPSAKFDLALASMMNAVYSPDDFDKLHEILSSSTFKQAIEITDIDEMIKQLDNVALTNCFSSFIKYELEWAFLLCADGYCTNHFKWFSSLDEFPELLERRERQFLSNVVYQSLNRMRFNDDNIEIADTFFTAINGLFTEEVKKDLVRSVASDSYITDWTNSSEAALRLLIKHNMLDLNSSDIFKVFENYDRQRTIPDKERIITENLFLEEKLTKKTSENKKIKI